MYSVHKTDIINIAAKQVRKQNLVVFYLRDCPGKTKECHQNMFSICMSCKFRGIDYRGQAYLVRDSENGTARRGTLSHFNVLAVG